MAGQRKYRPQCHGGRHVSSEYISTSRSDMADVSMNISAADSLPESKPVISANKAAQM